MIESNLARIAAALEAIAQAMNPGFVVVADDVADIPVASPTLTKPPLEWFAAVGGAAIAVEDADSVPVANDSTTGQTTWDWLGITPPAKRSRSKMPTSGKSVSGIPHHPGEALPEIRKGAERGNTRAGQCGRCGRAGRRRLNFKPYCVDCEFEPEWDE